MNRTTHLTLRRTLPIALILICGLGGILLRHQYQRSRSIATIHTLGGNVGAIGGWPFPMEYYVYFPQADSIRDEQIVYLQDLRAMVRGIDYLTISFRDQPISDQGLEHLEKLTFADSMILVETNVSPGAVGQLRRKLPRCRIITD